jgi:glucokinase
LGGTKLLAALINERGRIIAHKSLFVEQNKGIDGLLKDFARLAEDWPAKSYKSVSVASAGPLHSARGVLLDPTNFFTNQKSWGVIPLVAKLRKIFKKPVWLENDAAAAVLAESWKGGHGHSRANVLAITLGTGVGIGAIANGQLVRAGQGLHPEASHIPINAEDKNYPCSCGAYGCIEANLGGTHFAKRLSRTKGRELTGSDCVELAGQGDSDTLQAFAEYGLKLAFAIRTFSVLFAPQVVVLSGGFSHAAKYYLPVTESELPRLLERYREGVDLLPKISISKLGDFAGVLGAAHVAIHRK